MPSSRLEDAFNELRAMRRARRSDDLSSYIEQLLKQHWDPEEARVLQGELLGEYQRHGRYADAEGLLETEVKRRPMEACRHERSASRAGSAKVSYDH